MRFAVAVLSTNLLELGFEHESLQLSHQYGGDGTSRYVYVISFAFFFQHFRSVESFRYSFWRTVGLSLCSEVRDKLGAVARAISSKATW
jgi:hypothetical protein